LPTHASQINCILFCSAAKNFVFQQSNSNRLHFALPRSQKFRNCEQKHWILFNRAAKIFGIVNESTVFCSTTQRRILEFANKSNSNCLYFVQPRSEKFWNCEKKYCILVSHATKFFGIANKPLYFVQPRSEIFGIYQQKQNKLRKKCTVNRAAKDFGIY
jgi:hypothetical protein